MVAKQEYLLRLAIKNDFENIVELFASHYVSDLTSRDPDSGRRLLLELEGVKDGSTIVVVAVSEDKIIGAAIATLNRDFSNYETTMARKAGYLSKNVVHKDFRYRGIGQALVGARIQILKDRGIEVAYSSHHADNIGSAKALDALGFEYVESYEDPEKRPTGSRMTTVRRATL